jgi:hypothetical protein
MLKWSTRGWRYRARSRVYGFIMSTVFPGMAEGIRRESEEQPFGKVEAAAPPQHKLVMDRGSDTTIVTFSSSAMLYAGQPTREFERFFERHDQGYNLIFFRDLHRSGYHLTPDGDGNGVAFHEAELKEELAKLGSTRHIAIGDSAGAAASMYYGSRLGFERVIAFSPSFPLRHYIGPWEQIRALTDIPLLWREPRAYFEHVTLSLTPFYWLYLAVGWRMGFTGFWDPVEEYRRTEKRPRLTVFYGGRNRAESNILRPIKDLPEVDLRPLPTARHVVMMALARTGKLGPTLRELVERPNGSGQDATPLPAAPVPGRDP